MLKIGTGRSDMTPAQGVAHTLWGARTRETAESIHWPLAATALCIDSMGARVLIVDLDLTGLPTDVSTEIRKDLAELTAIPFEAIQLSFTHTHSSPVWNAEQTNGSTPDMPGMWAIPLWRAQVRQAIRHAALTAVADLQPARVASGTAPCFVTVNRRYKTPEGRMVVGVTDGGIRDPNLNLIRFDALDGSTLASVVGYGTHPIVLAHANTAISSEYPGVLKATVEAVLGGTCLFLQGCAGDQIPYEALSGEVEMAERIGRHIGADALGGLVALRPRPWTESFNKVVESGAPLAELTRSYLPDLEVPVAVLTKVIDLPVKEFRPIDELARAAEETKAAYQKIRAENPAPEVYADYHFRARRADIMLGMAKRAQGVQSVSIEIRALAIGQTAILSLPMEPFAETGMAIRAASPFKTTFVNGYTNGTEGYLPMDYSYSEGGYEVELATYVSPAAEGIFRAAAIELLADLAATTGLTKA